MGAPTIATLDGTMQRPTARRAPAEDRVAVVVCVDPALGRDGARTYHRRMASVYALGVARYAGGTFAGIVRHDGPFVPARPGHSTRTWCPPP
jgi:hypothetical protein